MFGFSRGRLLLLCSGGISISIFAKEQFQLVFGDSKRIEQSTDAIADAVGGQVDFRIYFVTDQAG